MDKGTILREKIHKILYEVCKYNKSIDNLYIKYNLNKLSLRDRKFVNNVCMNSMRYSIHAKKILKLFVKKKQGLNENVLFSSAVAQIVFLDFKEYAVINSTVDIAKKLKIYHGFVNAVLKKIAVQKNKLKNIKLNFSDLPTWFTNEVSGISNNDEKGFLNSFIKEPDIHLVFKSENDLKRLKEKIIHTSKTSGFLYEKKKIEEVSNYKNGNWWVQDFSSSLPLNFIDKNFIDEPCIDLCAAPGGKSFQVLSKNINISLNDKSRRRLKILSSNLKRLNYNPKITNFDTKDIEDKLKYKFLILDAPCSAVGTIRRNPEIFFRLNKPKISELINLQSKMLDKAAQILEKNGLILYMVCSFLEIETTKQISNFLKRNVNFSIHKFIMNNEISYYKKFIKDNFMITLPTEIKGYNIDGYFAVYLKRDK